MSVFQYPYVGVSNFICLREYLYASKKEFEYSFTNSILKPFISNPKSRKPLKKKNEKETIETQLIQVLYESYENTCNNLKLECDVELITETFIYNIYILI